MANIGFIGLGNMGGPMVANLIADGHSVAVFDISADAVKRAVDCGGVAAGSAVATAEGAEVIITMLPAGAHVRSVYVADDAVLDALEKGALVIDCSTIDVPTARDMIVKADSRGIEMIDAPVSGGVGGAAAGTLTFMCGGTDSAFGRAEPILQAMGKNIFHAGAAGAGAAGGPGRRAVDEQASHIDEQFGG